jgi:hypothetical protein
MEVGAVGKSRRVERRYEIERVWTRCGLSPTRKISERWICVQESETNVNKRDSNGDDDTLVRL